MLALRLAALMGTSPGRRALPCIPGTARQLVGMVLRGKSVGVCKKPKVQQHIPPGFAEPWMLQTAGSWRRRENCPHIQANLVPFLHVIEWKWFFRNLAGVMVEVYVFPTLATWLIMVDPA